MRWSLRGLTPLRSEVRPNPQQSQAQLPATERRVTLAAQSKPQLSYFPPLRASGDFSRSHVKNV